MKLALVHYCCADCTTAFDHPDIAPERYGEFLLRADSGELAYLNAPADPVYDEVDRLLAELPVAAGLRPVARAGLLHAVFGAAACDPSPSGVPFELAAPPACPSCGSRRMATWEFKQPPEIVELAVPEVGHAVWSGMATADKLARLTWLAETAVRPGQATHAAPKPAAAKTNAWPALLLSRDEDLRRRLAELDRIPALMDAMLPPFHPGDALAGAARTLAEALLLFGPERCRAAFELLLEHLPRASRDMDPGQPGRVPTTLGLLGFVLIARNGGFLAADAMQAKVSAWIEALRVRQPPAEAAARIASGLYAAAFGADDAAAELLDCAKPVPPEDTPVRGLGCRLLATAGAGSEGPWRDFLADFPHLLEASVANWLTVHVLASIALGRTPGRPPGEIAGLAHRETMRAIAGRLGEAP
ncbi:MAG: hypothetical protein RBU37_19475 [Myxococcota bacterium]|nr:hypothetical protein [Myxococcota bacterium]